jgi:hypothetical protein
MLWASRRMVQIVQGNGLLDWIVCMITWSSCREHSDDTRGVHTPESAYARLPRTKTTETTTGTVEEDATWWKRGINEYRDEGIYILWRHTCLYSCRVSRVPLQTTVVLTWFHTVWVLYVPSGGFDHHHEHTCPSTKHAERHFLEWEITVVNLGDRGKKIRHDRVQDRQ